MPYERSVAQRAKRALSDQSHGLRTSRFGGANATQATSAFDEGESVEYEVVDNRQVVARDGSHAFIVGLSSPFGTDIIRFGS